MIHVCTVCSVGVAYTVHTLSSCSFFFTLVSCVRPLSLSLSLSLSVVGKLLLATSKRELVA